MIKSSVENTLDEIDRAILKILQRDGRISHVELGQQVNLSSPAINARIKRLEQAGYIRRYVALLDREVMGYDMLCFISIRLSLHQYEEHEKFLEIVKGMPQVLECHHLTGEFDYLLKVITRNRQDLQNFIVHHIIPIRGVAQVYTSVVLTEVKSTTALPLE